MSNSNNLQILLDHYGKIKNYFSISLDDEWYSYSKYWGRSAIKIFKCAWPLKVINKKSWWF